MSAISLRTDRLLLRPWNDRDIEPFAAMCRDPEVMRFIGSGETRSRAQAAQSIHAFEREWDEHGFGLFAVELLEAQTFLGFTGLSVPAFLPEIMPSVEIGWRLAREHWGQGYATEAARAAMHFGFHDRKLAELFCIFQVENQASRNVATKIGMQFDRRTLDPTCNREVDVFRIRADAF